MKMSSLLCASALALAGCSNNDQPPPPAAAESDANDTAIRGAMPTGEAPTAPTAGPEYIAKAGAGDLWEIESSKALLAKSKNPAVRKFADMMIDHHGKSTAKIKAAAAAASIVAPATALEAAQRTTLDEIEEADATAIDALYLRHQRAAHESALALHRRYSESGDNAGLRQAASEILPVIEAHRAELDQLDQQAAARPKAD